MSFIQGTNKTIAHVLNLSFKRKLEMPKNQRLKTKSDINY